MAAKALLRVQRADSMPPRQAARPSAAHIKVMPSSRSVPMPKSCITQPMRANSVKAIAPISKTAKNQPRARRSQYIASRMAKAGMAGIT